MKKNVNKDPQHLLIVGPVWPEPGSSAAGRRMMQLIRNFQSQGWKITYASSAAQTDHMVDLERLDIHKVPIQLNDGGFDDIVRDLQPNVVMFDRFITEEQYGWRIAKQCPDALRILDTEDLHCLRRARYQAVRDNQTFTPEDLLSDETAKREIASILRCDLTLIISEVELQLLQELFSVSPSLTHYLPFQLESIGDEPKTWPPFRERSHFVTVGNFRHDPNRDAVIYLKKQIWPIIRKKLPHAELHIYGAYPSQQILDLHKPSEGFFVKGRVEDVQKVVKSARVCLAPLRFGAGLKGKLVEAMQCGTPSITTEVGAEGMSGGLPWGGVVANEPEPFAAAAVHLYNHYRAWKDAQENGIKIINARFDENLFEAKFLEKVYDLQNNLATHRRDNFTGSMLMHHTMAASKYMSRWIEAKNN